MIVRKKKTNEDAAPSFVARSAGRRRASLIVPLVTMGIAVATVGVAYAKVVPAVGVPAQCVADDVSTLVPEDGASLLGVNLDWDAESLPEHEDRLGHSPAVTVQFSDIPYDEETWEHTANAAEQVRQTGGALLLTLEPHGGLATMSEEVVDALVTDLREINDTGVPVLLRFAHEMNGSWYAWGQQPVEYIEVFRRVAAAVHEGAPGTAMMWAPNYGGGYPFTGGQFAARPGTEDFGLLDTDGDGVLTMADDSYLPYFPGDDAVDWVGISLYHWGNQRPWGDNGIPEEGKFAGMLTGTYHGTAGDDRAIPDFYEVYGVEHGFPIAIPETAAIYTPSRGGDSELEIKQAWWRQVFADETIEQFPQLKMINWFEWYKYEIEINDYADWRAASSPGTRDAFIADLPSWLRYGEDVSPCG